MDHGVIWLSLKTDYLFALSTVIESEASEVNAIIQNLIGNPMSIVILCASKNTGDEAFIEAMKKVNPDYVGPYDDREFDGMEAEIILYLSHYNEQFSIASMSRARRLLILVTWDWDRDYDELMENAVKEDLVLKFSIGDKIFRGENYSKTSEEGSELCSSSCYG